MANNATYSNKTGLAQVLLPNNNTYAFVDRDGRELIAKYYATDIAIDSGDYIIYSNPAADSNGDTYDNLFKCTTAVSKTSNTSWAAIKSNFTKVTVGSELKALRQLTTNPMHYRGTASTAISNNSTSSGGISNLQAGDIALYNGKEFVWDGSKWNEFGSTGSLRDFAFADSGTVSVSYTKPKSSGHSAQVTKALGTVTKKYFKAVASGATVGGKSGTQTTLLTGYEAPTKQEFVQSITLPTAEEAVTGVTGTKSNNNGVANVTTENISFANGTINNTAYKKLSKQSVSVVASNSSTEFYGLDTVGSLPTLTTTVSNDLLTISFSQGTLPTKTSKITASHITTDSLDVATGVTSSQTSGDDTFVGAVGTLATSSAKAVDQVTKGTFLTDVSVSKDDFIPDGTVSYSKVQAITALGTKSTDTIYKEFEITAQPTITIQSCTTSNGTYANDNPMQVVTGVATTTEDAIVTVQTEPATATGTASPAIPTP